METATTWVFKAGDGAMPPALTGRTTEQSVLRRCLVGVSNGEAPPHNVVLVGPRGNGKTTLLYWFQRACSESKPAVDVLSLTPSTLPSPAALSNALAPPRGLAKLLPHKVGIASVGSAEWERANGPRDLVAALVSRCRRRPLVVLLDEAHTLSSDTGAALLNASQQVRGAAVPFLLVLAGTPGLAARLNTMNASFWSRLGEGELGIGRLSKDAARQALTDPLGAHDVDIDAQVLASVVAESQCYPYFIQLWGHALWQRRLATNATDIGEEHVRAVAPVVAAQVARYYQQRFAELETEGLVPAAVAVAKLFEHGAVDATDQEVNGALADAQIEDAKARLATREALNRLGYIWQPPDQQAPIRWQPGIPSLMTHVLQQAASG